MFIDAHKLLDGAELSADVCIIGAGPAGISLARELIGTSLSVIVLESGGLQPEREPQELSAPAQLNFGNVPAISSNRQFGGNASLWTVQTGATWFGIRLLPLAPVDFQKRPWLAESGWPITRADLEPYYARAQQTFRIGPHAYEGEDWANDSRPALQLPAERLRTRMFQFGDGTLFLREYRSELERAPNITTYYHATAVELEPAASGDRVAAVRAKSAPQRELRVRAKQIVLTTGALAATQLLLNSDAVHPGGMGNGSGVLGHYLMDHPYLSGGEFVPASRSLFERTTLYDMRWEGGTPMMGHLQVADEALANEPLLGLSMLLFPRERNFQAHRTLSPRQERGFYAALELHRALVSKRRPNPASVGKMLLGADGIVKRTVDRVLFPKSLIGRGGWSRLRMKRLRFHSYEVVQTAEQAPHDDNRITLSGERDALGMRRIAINWRWHDEDIAATMRAQELYATELRRAGLGEFRIAREHGGPKVLSHSTAHYLGTTRMHADPRRGVVDADCRVHGVENLYVASGSVFPTGGFANPTLTIVALALRVADRLQQQHGREAPAAAFQAA